MLQWLWKNLIFAMRATVEIMGAIWLLGELIAVVSSQNSNFFSAMAVIVVAIVLGVARFGWICTKPFWTRSLNDGMHLKIRMGDITKQRGCAILVGTNNELNCNDADINRSSIQYQLQTNPALGPDIKRAFQNEKGDRPTVSYGTVISVRESNEQGQQKAESDRVFHFLVMSELETNQNAQTTMQELDMAIGQYFQQLRQLYVPNKKLEVPLIGTGIAGVCSQTNAKIDVAVRLVRHLIQSRDRNQRQSLKEMVIRIHWRDFQYIDWHQLDTLIEHSLQVCQECKCSE